MNANADPDGTPKIAVFTFLATAVGIPSAVLAFLRDEVAVLPLAAKAALLVLWVALTLMSALWAAVWKNLRDAWAKELARWIDAQVREILSPYRRRYLEFLYYQHRDFDVKGLSTHGPYNLELEDVFVDLTLQPRAVHDASADPIRIPQELTGRRQIWDYLESPALADQPLVLIGPPGSGKTTLLKEIALRLTGRHRRRRRLKPRLPILLFLREHAEAVRDNKDLTLPQVVENALARKHGPAPPSGWIERQLQKGRCLVLLDGLDEVAAVETRGKVVAWVEAQMKAYGKNQFFVSSRPHGYRSRPITGVSVLEVQSFSGEQVRRFVFNWYRANEAMASQKVDPGVKMKAREGAEDLMQRLRTSQTLLELAVNPLLLTMIATVHRYRSSLPGRRVELYAEICEVFLGKRQAARGVEDALTPAQKQRVLQPLAFSLMEQEKREIHVDDATKIILKPLCRVAGKKADAGTFLKDVEKSSGLMLERETGVYGFAHLAFQEYLAAVHAREEGEEPVLLEQIENSWWHETIRLYGAQGDVSSILAECLASEPPTVAALTLAIDFLEEAREADSEWREKVDSFISEGAESEEPERFRLAAETLLTRRIRDMVAVDATTYIDPTYVTHAEYQLFLDEMRVQRKFHQPDHWDQWRFPEGKALTPIVGMRPSDVKSFCQFLSTKHGPWTFRPPNVGELKRHGLRDAHENNEADVSGYWAGSDLAVFEVEGADPTPSLRSYLSTDLIRNLDLDLVRVLNRDLDRARIHVRVRVRVRDLNRVLDRDRALDLDRVRDRILDRARIHVRYRDRDLARVLVRDLDRVLDLDLDRVPLFLSSIRRSKVFFLRLLRKPSAQENEWPSIYTAVAILDGRRQGKLKAFEGIRLVKERTT